MTTDNEAAADRVRCPFILGDFLPRKFHYQTANQRLEDLAPYLRDALSAIAAHTAASGETISHSIIPHDPSLNCCGCYNITWNEGEPIATCNECGHKVELLDSLINTAASAGEAVGYYLGEQNGLGHRISFPDGVTLCYTKTRDEALALIDRLNRTPPAAVPNPTETQKMKANRLASQREDGGFDHFVTFGNKAPWDADDDESVQCATEVDALKLERIVNGAVSHCSDERPCTPCFSDSGKCEDTPPAAVPADALLALQNDIMEIVGTCDDIGQLGNEMIGFANRIAALIPKGAV